MADPKHTQGTWKVERQEDYDGRTKGMFVEKIGPWHIEWHDDLNKGAADRIEADIALTKAAPNLLKALQLALRLHPELADRPPIRAAIARATPQRGTSTTTEAGG